MTLANPVHDLAQSFLFRNVDWNYYEETLRRLEGQRVFVTYYKGRLEIVTVSFIHDRTSRLLYRAVTILADESKTPIVSAGTTTLRRKALNVGLEADEAFYIANHAAVMKKKELDMDVDPPPDLALEVEITRRLGERSDIYRDLGVPEIWRYTTSGLKFLVKRRGRYEPVRRSPTFPWLSAEEITGFIEAGLAMDETAWATGLRQRIGEAITQHKQK